MTALDDIDAGLVACCEVFKDALDIDDQETADVMSAAMDRLLERRSHACREK